MGKAGRSIGSNRFTFGNYDLALNAKDRRKAHDNVYVAGIELACILQQGRHLQFHRRLHLRNMLPSHCENERELSRSRASVASLRSGCNSRARSKLVWAGETSPKSNWQSANSYQFLPMVGEISMARCKYSTADVERR